MIRDVTANGLRLHPIYSEVAFCVGRCHNLSPRYFLLRPSRQLATGMNACFSYGRSGSDLFVACDLLFHTGRFAALVPVACWSLLVPAGALPWLVMRAGVLIA